MNDRRARPRLLLLRLRKVAWMMRHKRWRRLLRRGFAPSIEHHALLSKLCVGSVLDIGANHGQFAAWADEVLQPSVIHCFEPLASDLLNDVADMCRATVRVHQVALDSTKGRAEFNVTDSSDNSSLLRPVDVSGHTHAGRRVVQTIEVDVVPGDELLQMEDLPAPVLVKIDVQGAELAVLLGLARTFERIDAVLIELSLTEAYQGQSEFDEVVSWLADNGFKSVGGAAVPGTSEQVLEQIDVLFQRASATTGQR